MAANQPLTRGELMYKAAFYKKLDHQNVKCYLCSHYCLITPNSFGFCRQRQNISGTLYTLSYENLISASFDPVEKKPLYHFQPGSLSFSIATPGCNFTCLHCQNHQISQNAQTVKGQPVPAGKIIQAALSGQARSISHTYTEPTIFYEYLKDISRLAAENQLANIWVSNGYFSPELIKVAKPLISAANIDLKAFTNNFYKNICRATLKPVLNNIEYLLKNNIWLEITTLIIPNHNDSPSEIRAMAKWLKSLSPDLVWHLSAFWPTYKLANQPGTPAQTLREAFEIAKDEGLRYVYTALPGQQNTYCPECGELLITREAFKIIKNRLAANQGACFKCKNIIPGRWS